jgi:hypothetical protein
MTSTAISVPDANKEKASLIVKLGAAVRAREDGVVDIEES